MKNKAKWIKRQQEIVDAARAAGQGLTAEEQAEVKEQIKFMKQYRRLFQFGTFYRLKSPFEGDGTTAWMVVSDDKKEAIVGVYKILNGANMPFSRLFLKGLNPDFRYSNSVDGRTHYGDELMNAGLITTSINAGQEIPVCDFDSGLFILKAENELSI